jgi:hypothetical protein
MATTRKAEEDYFNALSARVTRFFEGYARGVVADEEFEVSEELHTVCLPSTLSVVVIFDVTLCCMGVTCAYYQPHTKSHRFSLAHALITLCTVVFYAGTSRQRVYQ